MSIRNAEQTRVDPTSQRGRRTRTALLEASKVVFARDGYVNAKISDIPKEAGVAVGSFYTYFSSKEDVLYELADTLGLPAGGHHIEGAEDEADIVAAIEETNRAYLEHYAQNAGLMSVFEEVAQVDPAFRARQRNRAVRFRERNARAIERMQKGGRVPPELNASHVALALGGMTSRMAYSVFVLGFEIPMDELVATVTDIWAAALGLPRRAAEPRRTGRRDGPQGRTKPKRA